MKRLVAALVSLVTAAAVVSAVPLELRHQYTPGARIRLTERADLRRYQDGRFLGLAYREVRGVLEATAEGGASRLDGEFFVFEETLHDTRLVAKRVDEVVPVSLAIGLTGETVLEGEVDPGYPTLRSFPVLPSQSVEPGTGWQAFGVRVVEPLRDGTYTRVPIYSDYKLKGMERRNGREVAVIQAQYAMRYRAGQDPAGDARIKGISGKHVVTIWFDPVEMRPVYMSDQMEEEYTLAEGKTLGFKGFILTWFDGVQPMNRVRLAQEVTETLKEGGVEGVTVTAEGEGGVKLTVNSIRFVADKAVVLPEERARLTVLAEALSRIPDRTFLVVGHTARFGTVESQETLSVDRAKAIVDELTSRGIDPARFIYEGRGAREPVAPNDTEANMASNRRVEIIILED